MAAVIRAAVDTPAVEVTDAGAMVAVEATEPPRPSSADPPGTRARAAGRRDLGKARSPQTEDLGHQRRIHHHVRRDGVVADGVYPGVAGAQGEERLDHPWAEIAEHDEDER
jgi:hypothetical protein